MIQLRGMQKRLTMNYDLFPKHVNILKENNQQKKQIKILCCMHFILWLQLYPFLSSYRGLAISNMSCKNMEDLYNYLTLFSFAECTWFLENQGQDGMETWFMIDGSRRWRCRYCYMIGCSGGVTILKHHVPSGSSSLRACPSPSKDVSNETKRLLDSTRQKPRKRTTQKGVVVQPAMATTSVSKNSVPLTTGVLCSTLSDSAVLYLNIMRYHGTFCRIAQCGAQYTCVQGYIVLGLRGCVHSRLHNSPFSCGPLSRFLPRIVRQMFHLSGDIFGSRWAHP